MGFIHLAPLRVDTGLQTTLCPSFQFRVEWGFQKARNRALETDFHRESTQGKKLHGLWSTWPGAQDHFLKSLIQRPNSGGARQNEPCQDVEVLSVVFPLAL